MIAIGAAFGCGEEMFSDYIYFTSNKISNHFKNYAEDVMKPF